MSKKEIQPTRMTIAASYTLYKTLTTLIYGPDKDEERCLPFKIKYKLLRSKDMLEKDVVFFENERANLVKEFGEATEEGFYKVKPENIKDFNKELEKILKIEVEHKLPKLSPEDLDDFDVEGLSADSISLFMAALVDDPDYIEDIQRPINKESVSKSEENSKVEE